MFCGNVCPSIKPGVLTETGTIWKLCDPTCRRLAGRKGGDEKGGRRKWKEERMGLWKGGWMSGWKEGKMYGWIKGWMDGWIDGRRQGMNACMHACMQGSVKPSWVLVSEGFRDWTWIELG